MSCRGVLFALMDDELSAVLTATSDLELLEVIQDGIEERWDVEWLVQTDKAWDAIHRCLTDGALQYENGEEPLRLCILGGRQLFKGEDYVVSLKEPSQCAELANALANIHEEWFAPAILQSNPKITARIRLRRTSSTLGGGSPGSLLFTPKLQLETGM